MRLRFWRQSAAVNVVDAPRANVCLSLLQSLIVAVLTTVFMGQRKWSPLVVW